MQTIPSSPAPTASMDTRVFCWTPKTSFALMKEQNIDGSNDDYDGAEAAKCCRRNISFEMTSLLRQLSKPQIRSILGRSAHFLLFVHLSSQSCLCCALLGNKSSPARCLGNLDPGKPRFLGNKFRNQTTMFWGKNSIQLSTLMVNIPRRKLTR